VDIEKLGEISDAVIRELHRWDAEHSCIKGAALLTQVMHRMGHSAAYLLTVGVTIANPAHKQWVDEHGNPHDDLSWKGYMEAGGFITQIGKGAGSTEQLPPDQWEGHLAVALPDAIQDRPILLDPTIIQANKLGKGINLPPLLWMVSDEFLAGHCPIARFVNGCYVRYEAYPDDHSYNDHGDVMAIIGLDEAVSHVVGRLRR